MVMRLPRPQQCSVTLLDDVVRERLGGSNALYFTGIKTEWKARTQVYLDNGGSPAHVPQWAAIPENKKKSFKYLYTHPAAGSAQGIVLDDLNDHELNLCPACGEFGKPNTLDHYLPKGKYPHFSITPANLFPMCDSCQKEKLEKTHTARESRLFLHPYFDDFVERQIIRIVIHPPYDTPAFTVELMDWLSNEQRAVVQAHIRELAIERRFAGFFKGESIRILKHAAKIRTGNQTIEESIELFRSLHEDPTLNSWQHLYYRAVLDNPDMLNYLATGILPANI
jgi:5-methylcytosine-specific restriction endonuclease McrA/aryl carrier-like protein